MHHTPGIFLNNLGIRPRLYIITGGNNNPNTFIRAVLKRSREVKIYKAYCFQHQDEVRAIENNSYFKSNELDDWDKIRLLKRYFFFFCLKSNLNAFSHKTVGNCSH